MEITKVNKDMIKGGWKVLKGKVQQQWGDLTDSDLKVVEGNFNELAGRLQAAYGYTKEKALAEIDNFKQKYMSEESEDDDLNEVRRVDQTNTRPTTRSPY